MLLVEDRGLLTRFREGERKAMAVVFEHYIDGVTTFLRCGFAVETDGLRFAGLQQRHDLHDFAAETFRRAFEERARMAYSGLSPYAAYLRTIARNLVLDRLRSKASRWLPLEETTEVASDLHNSQPTPENGVKQAELAALVQGFLQELTDAQRELVRLRYEEGMAQHEVATAMKQSRRWVRKQEVEVRRHMLRHLRGTGYLPKLTGDERRELTKHVT